MREKTMILKSSQAMNAFARQAAEKILKAHSGDKKGATVIGLEGELGSGKTLFTRAFARALRVKEKVPSPTFLIQKIYLLPRRRKDHAVFNMLVHIDAYRLQSARELLALGWRALSRDRQAIILVEWSDRVKKLLPEKAPRLLFVHTEKKNERRVTVKNFSW